MTTTSDTDFIVAEWIHTSAPPAAPRGLHEVTLVRVRRTRQQPRWLATLTTSGLARADDRPPATLAVRTFASAVLIGLLLVVGAVAIGGLPSQTPVQIVSPMRADTFIVPFEYDIPAGSALRPVSSWQGRQATAWVEGTDPDSIYGGQTQERSNQHGIIVASAVGTSTHSCTRDQGQGRRALRSAPADFLSDLQLVAGASMGTVETSSIDGHPALISDIDSEGECADGDVHVAGGPPLADYIKLSMPARILTADVDGQPIFVVIWARTSEDLASFMPTANAFVDSIHFLSTSRATPSPSPSPTATDSPTVRDTTTSDSSDTATATAQFVVPFDVTIPAGSALRPASGEAAPEIVAWIEGPDRPLGRRPGRVRDGLSLWRSDRGFGQQPRRRRRLRRYRVGARLWRRRPIWRPGRADWIPRGPSRFRDGHRDRDVVDPGRAASSNGQDPHAEPLWRRPCARERSHGWAGWRGLRVRDRAGAHHRRGDRRTHGLRRGLGPDPGRSGRLPADRAGVHRLDPLPTGGARARDHLGRTNRHW